MPSIEAIIDRQLRRWEMERGLRAAQPASEHHGPPEHPVITISRERGSGGTHVAELVASRFGYTLLHHDVIDRMCRSSGIHRSILEALDEHTRSQIEIWCDAMLGQHYTDADDYVRLLLVTIRSVATLGGVVVVGRGANFIVGPDRGLHVRIVGPRERRIQRLMEHEHLSEQGASQELTTKDQQREEFIRKVYGKKISDPHAYDLVINTGAIRCRAAAHLVESAAHEKFAQLARVLEPVAEIRQQW